MYLRTIGAAMALAFSSPASTETKPTIQLCVPIGGHQDDDDAPQPTAPVTGSDIA